MQILRAPAAALFLVVVVLALPGLSAQDKNGVSPQAISLPSGPGSIQGLGESFQPQLNGGGASYSIPLNLPAGTGKLTPELRLSYDSGQANGPLGMGWMVAGAVSVSRNIDHGVPFYVDGPNGLDDDGDGTIDNPEEIDVFSGLDREELVPLADGSYRAESETAFTRYERSGGGWVARRKDGSRVELGGSSPSRIESGGQVFEWLADRTVDIDGNAVEFTYITDPASPGQRYLSRIRWGRPTAFFTAVLVYEPGRPDIISSYLSGFEVRTALRLARIDVVSQGLPARADAVRGDLNSDGTPDALVRRWVLEYQASTPVSLLARVTQLGADGVTALAPVTLEYTSWSPPDSVAALVIPSLGEPAETLSSASVELCDMNGDGLPDLLMTSGNTHRAALNLGMAADGRLEWSSPVAVGNAPNVDIASPTAHLADATADGLSDLVVKVSNTRFLCFDNTSQNSWTSGAAPLRNTDTWPIWPFDGANGVASRSMDTDHNRRNDVLFTSQSGYSLWQLLPQGQYAREVRIAPLKCDEQTFRFDLPGTHIGDMNGDRLQDLVWVQASRLIWFANQGRDRFGACKVLQLNMTLAAADIEKSGLSDIDGDGLEDLTVVRPSTATRSVLYWLNRFQDGPGGLDGPRRLDGLPAAQAGDTLRWADMNGSGSTDIVIANSARPPGERILVIELVPDGKPYVLARAANGLGLVTTLEHETSADQMVRARREGRPWTSTMQMSIPVVRRISEDDSLGNVNVREITYRDPFWDSKKQEFRGFRAAQLREVGDDTASDRITRHLFDAGVDADCMKGKLLLQEVLDETGKVFSRTESTWIRRVLEVGTDAREVCFAYAGTSDTTVIEGIEQAILTRDEKDYDRFGNAVFERNLGVVDVPGDEVVLESEYDLHPEVWRMDRLSRRVTLDGQGKRVAEQRFFYDARGHLVRQESWLDTENRFIAVLRNKFDAFGNIVEVLDSNGRRRSVGFDDLIHAYPVSETAHLDGYDLTTTAAYDLGLGVILSSTDVSGVRTDYEYDALGRITATRYSGGAAELYSYTLSSPVSHTLTRTIEDGSGSTHDAYTFYDGYGRRLSKSVEAGDDQWRVIEAVAYNSRKLVARRWLSWLSDSNAWEAPDPGRPHHTERFDAQGRPVEKTFPDGSLERSVHFPLRIDLHDAEDTASGGPPNTQRMDGRGRLIEVIQRVGGQELHTRYQWSPLENLVQVTDAQGNVRTEVYDSLRRKISMDDPDGSRKTYAYDDAGNVIRTQDASGNVVKYTYDFANRLLTEDYVDAAAPEDPVDIRYQYDEPVPDVDFGDGTVETATFTGGRVAAVFDRSGEEHTSYDARGNISWSLKRIRDPRLGVLAGFGTRHQYDLMDRLVGLTYPDGDRARFVYGDASLLDRVDGGEEGRVVLSRLGYSETGQVARIEWGNGVVTLMDYDQRDRMRQLRVDGPGGLLLLDGYQYDPVSNIVKITDQRPLAAVPQDSGRRRTAGFVYDELYRLTRVRYSSDDGQDRTLGLIDYQYDGIGNMLSQTTPPAGQPGHLAPRTDLVFGSFAFAGGRSNRVGRAPGDPPGPRAVTESPDGRLYGYDERGNVKSIGARRLTWDPKNRLLSSTADGVITRFTYDHGGVRSIESVSRSPLGPGQDEVTYWVNQWFEVRPGSDPVKYLFNGESRMARIKGALDPSAPRIQRLWLAGGWNPVTIAVGTTATVSSLFGSDAQVLLASGRTFTPVAPAAPVPVGRALLVLVGSARVVAVRGPYAPPSGRFTLSVTEGYAAWPLLEPLVPSRHLEGLTRIFSFDPPAAKWALSDPSLPSFLSDLKRAGAGGAVWVNEPAAVEVDAALGSGEDILFYHQDHLGSTALVTDLSGAVVEETIHAPYGAELFQASSGTVDAFYGFTGKERDESTGLSYFGARWYDASIGRFLSVDPLYQETQSLEPDDLKSFVADPRKLASYAYAANNPLSFVDPDGQDFEAVGPRADEFVEMVSQKSGLQLQRDAETGKITVDPDGLMDPTVSPTLQNLVERIIYDPNKLVRITAMGKPDSDLLVDTFNANAGINPARTVHMLDFREVGKVSPHLATVFLSHVLAEYYQAARPRGRPPAQGNAAFNPAHRHAERVEAQVASELTGEALFPNRTRNIVASPANTFTASYGRNLWFVIRFQPGTRSINSIGTSEAFRKK